MKASFYVIIWLVLFSPFSIFMFLGCLSTNPLYPTILEFIGILLGSYFYYQAVWIPVRKTFNNLDSEFCKIMGW